MNDYDYWMVCKFQLKLIFGRLITLDEPGKFNCHSLQISPGKPYLHQSAPSCCFYNTLSYNLHWCLSLLFFKGLLMESLHFHPFLEKKRMKTILYFGIKKVAVYKWMNKINGAYSTKSASIVGLQENIFMNNILGFL